ncbi:MAG: Crp/Fnr family transcriptional regulator [Actinomycetota bacterium]
MGPAVATDTPDRHAAFRSVPLIRALAEPERRTAWDHARLRTVRRGEVLVAQGAPTETMLLLLDGEVTSIAVAADGRDVSLGQWSGPSVVDKVTMFAETHHLGSVIAETPATLALLPFDLVRAAIHRSTDAVEHVLRRVLDEARSARRAFRDASTLTSLERVARWMMTTAAVGVQLEIPRPQERLARQLGMTRVTLNRVVHQLVRDRVIDLDGSTVTIVDSERLRRIAQL